MMGLCTPVRYHGVLWKRTGMRNRKPFCKVMAPESRASAGGVGYEYRPYMRRGGRVFGAPNCGCAAGGCPDECMQGSTKDSCNYCPLVKMFNPSSSNSWAYLTWANKDLLKKDPKTGEWTKVRSACKHAVDGDVELVPGTCLRVSKGEFINLFRDGDPEGDGYASQVWAMDEGGCCDERVCGTSCGPSGPDYSCGCKGCPNTTPSNSNWCATYDPTSNSKNICASKICSYMKDHVIQQTEEKWAGFGCLEPIDQLPTGTPCIAAGGLPVYIKYRAYCG